MPSSEAQLKHRADVRYSSTKNVYRTHGGGRVCEYQLLWLVAYTAYAHAAQNHRWQREFRRVIRAFSQKIFNMEFSERHRFE